MKAAAPAALPPRRTFRLGPFRLTVGLLILCFAILSVARSWSRQGELTEADTWRADESTISTPTRDTRSRRGLKASGARSRSSNDAPQHGGSEIIGGPLHEPTSGATQISVGDEEGDTRGSDAAAAVTPLVLLKAPYAVCLDGSHAGYYHRPAPPGGEPHKWVIVLGDGDGSSECFDKNACRAKGKTKFGASKLFEPTLEEVTPEPALLAHNCAGFCGWHHVLLPYCSQDWWAGRAARPSKRTWGRHFAGHEILRAALDALSGGSTAGPDGVSLSDATEVLLAGAGAGGHGVWANADFVATRLPRARVSALALNAFHAPCQATHAYAGSGRVALQPAADWSCAALSGTCTSTPNAPPHKPRRVALKACAC